MTSRSGSSSPFCSSSSSGVSSFSFFSLMSVASPRRKGPKPRAFGRNDALGLTNLSSIAHITRDIGRGQARGLAARLHPLNGGNMRLRGRTKVGLIAVLVLAVCALTASAGTATGASAAASLVPLAGTGSPQAGDFTPSGVGDATQAEFPGQGDEEQGPDAYSGNIVDRSLSTGPGNGASVNSGKKAKSNPIFNFGFEGLNHYQQRYSRGGNQFSLEPPDQGMCVGNGYVVEAVNDVFNVYDSGTGASVLP